jgi:hypothetical protein
MKKGMTREDSLAAVPIVNPTVKAARSASGLITLHVPRREDNLGRILITVFRVSPDVTKKVQLDEMGSFVWELCDGKNDVRAMVERLRERYHLEWKEAEVSLAAFMRSLMKKRLVALMLEKKR